MTDPVSAEMASQAVQTAAEPDGVEEASPTADFSESMAEAGPGVDGAEAVDGAQQVEAPQDVDAVEETSEIPTDDFIQRMMEEESNIERMMEDCLNGAEMDQQDMLQMQAVIYSYSQRVDLTTKVVENATSGIKEVMNTQV